MVNYRVVCRAIAEPTEEGKRIVSFEFRAASAAQALRAAAGENPLWRVLGIEPGLQS